MNTDSEDISMLAEIETVPREVTEEELEQEFPVMTLRNMVMFPSVVMPITAGRRTTLKLVNAALKIVPLSLLLHKSSAKWKIRGTKTSTLRLL